MKKVAVEELTDEVFAEHLGDSFGISLDDNLVEFKLIEVSDMGAEPFRTGARKPFSLHFQLVGSGVDETQLAQRIFEIQHEQLGGMELFLTPSRSEGNMPGLEAVFN